MKRKKYRLVFLILAILGLALLAMLLLAGSNAAVLNPKGTIAEQQRDLMIIAGLLSLVVIIPVFALTFGIAWKYREGNKKAIYKPNWDNNRWLELVWWGIPCLIILVLGVIAWKSTHELDPYKPISSNTKPITVQVIALEWKWLFIYPDYGIASVNTFHVPEDTPINFRITADAPMNSFWIPQLGGQVYAMAGMQTKLHLMASEQGSYRGSSANLSGEGFAGMNFTAKATSKKEFDNWIRTVGNSTTNLSMDEYTLLSRPSKAEKPLYYASADKDLYDTVIMKYMMPKAPVSDAQGEASL
jgi:cytochrome o ubiquinol oxidase subunit 2